jgi:hypothetical protein
MLRTSSPPSETISFLTSEADAALMFTSLASFEWCAARRTGHINNARSRYDRVLRSAARVLLKVEDRQALDARLACIRTKLEILGERF